MSDFPSALPIARTPDPLAAPALRWGVIGPGWIAQRFIGSLRQGTRQQVLAVGSRDLARSQAFAADHGIERAYGSYADLLPIRTSTSSTSPPRTMRTTPALCSRCRRASTPWSRSRWR